MDHDLTALERAFQLANSGTCANVSEIKQKLKSEGYGLSQIEGSALLKQLRTLIKTALPSGGDTGAAG